MTRQGLAASAASEAALLFGLLSLLSLPLARAGGPGSGTNGFDLDPSSIPAEEIFRGGPARDGIPALVAPKVVAAHDAPWSDRERIIGIEVNGIERAYPIAILNWHELVNDTLSGVPVLVSYCPLCGTGMVFKRKLANRTRTFGVSGLLYQSDVLLYDRETESLWSQLKSTAVTGPALGTPLELLPSRHMTWGNWRRKHPNSTILSRETGYRRDYRRSPYRGYEKSERILFPVPHSVTADQRYPKKMSTLGIRTPDGTTRAYPMAEVVAAGGRVREELGGAAVTVSYSAKDAEFDATVPAEFDVIEGFWFAWLAFYPDSTVFVAPPPKGAPVND